jgi:uncharacterized sulfatase
MTLLVGAAIAYPFRRSLLLAAVGVAAHWTRPVAPAQEIRWSRVRAGALSDAASRPPNVILIVADDLGINDVSTFGGGVANGAAPTRHIDDLARRGVSFRSSYAGMATCAPSRAMMLTGRYSTRFGFEFTPMPPGMPRVIGAFSRDPRFPLEVFVDLDRVDRIPSYDRQGMPASEITIAELLRERGHHTIHIGKWHTGLADGMSPRGQGFDESLLMASGLYQEVENADVVNFRNPVDPIDQFLWATMQHAVSFDDGPWFRPNEYLTDYFTTEAVRAIEANRDRPFFLHLAHWAVHTPLQAHRADYDALSQIPDHRERVYAAMVRSLDRSVGRVVEALRANRLEENTLVIFTSDNGGPGYIGLPSVNAPYRGWKMTLFEGGLRVPLLIAWPGKVAGERVNTTFATHHVDLLPTIAAAVGARVPSDRVIDGVDVLSPAVLAEGSVRRTPLFFRDGRYRSVVHDGWKLQENGRMGRVWLFHLTEDPTERLDLAVARPEKVKELRDLLDAHDAAQVEPLFPSVIDAPIFVDKVLENPAAPTDEHVYWSN